MRSIVFRVLVDADGTIRGKAPSGTPAGEYDAILIVRDEIPRQMPDALSSDHRRRWPKDWSGPRKNLGDEGSR
jgi:hypothetical protein